MSAQDPQPGGSPASDWLSKVYQELRRKAQAYLNNERSGHTLNAMALVHEAYIKLAAGPEPADFEKTGHFYAAAAEAMRRILVDHARARLAQKRGGEGRRQGSSALDNAAVFSDEQSPEEILALDEALSRLAEQDAEAAQVVRLRLCLSNGRHSDAWGLSVPDLVYRHAPSPSTPESRTIARGGQALRFYPLLHRPCWLGPIRRVGRSH
jgi:RNA polymerase sigma factor (TIGR02999 family)